MRILLLSTCLLISVTLLGCNGGSAGVTPDGAAAAAGPFGRWVANASQTLNNAPQSGIHLTISIDPVSGVVTVTCGDQVIRSTTTVASPDSAGAEPTDSTAAAPGAVESTDDPNTRTAE